MPQPAIPNLHASLAICVLLALGACLDHSIPLAGLPEGKGKDTVTLGPEIPRPVEPNGGSGGQRPFGPDFDRMPIKDRFDSSLKAMRRLMALSKDTYQYKRSYASWIGYRDSTLISFAHGKVVSREVWFTYSGWNPYPKQSPQEQYFFEQGNIGSYPNGAPALSLDSLYEICRAHLPKDTIGQNWFSLDANYILSKCGSYAHTCADDCPPQVSLDRVVWPLQEPRKIPEPFCATIAPRVERDTILLIER